MRIESNGVTVVANIKIITGNVILQIPICNSVKLKQINKELKVVSGTIPVLSLPTDF